MSSANFKPKRTAAASRGLLATARLSCIINSAWLPVLANNYVQNTVLCVLCCRRQSVIHILQRPSPCQWSSLQIQRLRYSQSGRRSFWPISRTFLLTVPTNAFPSVGRQHHWSDLCTLDYPIYWLHAKYHTPRGRWCCWPIDAAIVDSAILYLRNVCRVLEKSVILYSAMDKS